MPNMDTDSPLPKLREHPVFKGALAGGIIGLLYGCRKGPPWFEEGALLALLGAGLGALLGYIRNRFRSATPKTDEHQKQRHGPDPIFLSFLAGVVVGAAFGQVIILADSRFYEQSEALVAFWAIVGGGLGFAIGFVLDLFPHWHLGKPVVGCAVFIVLILGLYLIWN
jgi:hypothetical protein